MWLPKVYDGRNRTFWMYGADKYDRVMARQGFYTVPMAPQRSGDFSSLLAISSQYQIYDPATIAPAPNGRYSRQPIPGNRIASSRILPAALKLLDYYPLPNTQGTVDGRNNYTDPALQGNDYLTHMVRADHVFTPNNRIFVSLTALGQTDFSLLQFHNDATGLFLDRKQRGAALDDVYVPRPDLAFNFRYSLTRFSERNFPPGLGFDLGSLGMPPSLVGLLDRKRTTVPEMPINGLTTIGVTSGSFLGSTHHSFNAMATHPRGNHSFRTGAEYRLLLDNSYVFGNISPQIQFGTTWTTGPLDNSPAAPIGQGLAAFLLNTPTGGKIDRNSSFAEASRYLAFFFQDDWKITRKLTVNLGLRYQIELPTLERFRLRGAG